ncbi:MAG: TIGR02646 family protein [Acidobacteria bacterium]|nr:TIGR02646 family protein [Acidobacteriota bacterium]
MHYVERGPEPPGLAEIRRRKTQRWIDHHRGQGSAPTDSEWRRFAPELGERFHLLCGYCERQESGDVDHFRPKASFPALVYQWSNWIYCCPKCNHGKGNQWPTDGYVDPCARPVRDQPEPHFTFDLAEGTIVPAGGLTAVRRRRAQSTIDDLRLNRDPIRRERLQWVRAIELALRNSPDPDDFVAMITARDFRLSSLARQKCKEMGLLP